MAFGNRFGIYIEHNLDPRDFFSPAYGDLVCEVKEGEVGNLVSTYTVIGEVTNTDMPSSTGMLSFPWMKLSEPGQERLKKVFRTKVSDDRSSASTPFYHTGDVFICSHKIAVPHVFIPVFPGTNCEYDSARAFEAARATVATCVFKNLTAEDPRFRGGVRERDREVSDHYVPGGFSAGDEPEGSAKFSQRLSRMKKIAKLCRSFWMSATAWRSASATVSRR